MKEYFWEKSRSISFLWGVFWH